MLKNEDLIPTVLNRSRLCGETLYIMKPTVHCILWLSETCFVLYFDAFYFFSSTKH